MYTQEINQGKYTDLMVALRITHENSSKGTTEYFFGDTLEYANKYTEWHNWEAFCESMENSKADPTLHRVKREAQDESWKHFHSQNRQNIQITKTDNIPIPGKLSEKQELEHQQIMEQAAWDNIGWICGGALTVIKALMNVITDTGTICMPAHTSDNSGPSLWENPPVPKEWVQEIYKICLHLIL
ncbi:MAG: AAC(3) family N-acetyltransferase [bacterium]